MKIMLHQTMEKSKLLAVLSLLTVCCTNCSPVEGTDKRVAIAKVSTTDNTNRSAINDEQEFGNLFKKFKKALADKNINTASTMVHFPFFTSYNQQENGMGAASDPISRKEFADYSCVIFNGDVLRLLPECKDDNFVEIDEMTAEIYYKSLKKLIDPGSKMYEVYMQYPETNTNSESFFGFVFGKLNGKFKATATYTKWPIK